MSFNVLLLGEMSCLNVFVLHFSNRFFYPWKTMISCFRVKRVVPGLGTSPLSLCNFNVFRPCTVSLL